MMEQTLSKLTLASHTERFEQNATVYFKVTNQAGIETTKFVTVSNIDTTPIAEDVHYSVEYTYENYLGIGFQFKMARPIEE